HNPEELLYEAKTILKAKVLCSLLCLLSFGFCGRTSCPRRSEERRTGLDLCSRQRQIQGLDRWQSCRPRRVRNLAKRPRLGCESYHAPHTRWITAGRRHWKSHPGAYRRAHLL